MSEIRTTRAPNGFAVITRRLPGARSVAVGLWLLNGCRHERDPEQGYAHLLEHLFFKGAGELDAAAIARLTDRWGGQVNAFTGRELTALHGLVPAAKAAELTRLLMNMVLDPRFSPEDLAAEQGVVLQEMAGQADSPDEAVETRAVTLACADHPLGRDILGRAETIEAATVEVLQRYRRGLLAGQRLALVAVGAVEHEALVAACAPLAALPAGERPAITPPPFPGGEHAERHRTGQAHLLWVLPGPAADGPGHAAAVLANQLLGSGVSSRLFQEVREKLGLVYDIRSSLETFSDCGLWVIQTACQPKAHKRCRAAVERVVAGLLADGPSEEELRDARDYLASVLVLEHDALEPHMERLAREHFYLGRHPSLEERLDEVAKVSGEAVRSELAKAWGQRLHLSWRP